MSMHAYVDFDGTIMACDTTDHLLERFALPAWRDVEAEWASGRIGSKECMARQVDLLRVTPAALDAAAADLDITAGFSDFARMCARRGIGLTVISDGLDRVIAATLRRCGIDLPYFANHLLSSGADTWRLEFPNSDPNCSVGAGHCKCARIAEQKTRHGEHPGDHPSEHLKVVIGDGRSDFCIAGRADLVLAKASLLEECRRKGMPHLAFDDFFEVSELLQGWLDAGSQTRPESSRVPLCV